MIKFQFIARCGGETMPLEVSMPYKPGKQGQRARRLAVGELLAALQAQAAEVQADGEERVVVKVDGAHWVIGEGGALSHSRGNAI